MSKPTLAMEVRAIVEEARRAGKPVTSEIIWGLVSRVVPEDGFAAELGRYCRMGWIVSVPGKSAGKGSGRGRPQSTYVPGPVPVREGDGERHPSRAMGNRAMLRLFDARKAAREWQRA